VPDGDYASFIEEYSDFVSKKGDYLDVNGKKIGEHKGVIHYTIGQRKGLGIALGKPAFVIEKNAPNNTVVIGDEKHIFHKKVFVNNVNFIPFDKLEKPMKVKTKLRYRHEQDESIITPLENGEVLIEFSKPQRAASIGQAAVFYDGDIVIGGGLGMIGVKVFPAKNMRPIIKFTQKLKIKAVEIISNMLKSSFLKITEKLGRFYL
jgi:tRNA-specific 2-thiouridylase